MALLVPHLPSRRVQPECRRVMMAAMTGLTMASAGCAHAAVQSDLASRAKAPVGCRAPTASRVTTSGAKSLLAAYAACFRAGNVTGIVALLTPGFVSRFNGSANAQGRTQARQLYRSEIDRVTNQTFRLTGIRAQLTPAGATSSAHYRLLKAQGKPLLRGRLVFSIVLEAGRLAIGGVDQHGS